MCRGPTESFVPGSRSKVTQARRTARATASLTGSNATCARYLSATLAACVDKASRKGALASRRRNASTRLCFERAW